MVGVYRDRILVPCHPRGWCPRHELRSGSPGRSSCPLTRLLLFPEIWRKELVHGARADDRCAGLCANGDKDLENGEAAVEVVRANQ